MRDRSFLSRRSFNGLATTTATIALLNLPFRNISTAHIFTANRRVSVTDPPWHADATGTRGAADNIQACIDWVESKGGGEVFAPEGSFLIEGNRFIDVKSNVSLIGAGKATRFTSQSGGKSGHHVLLHLKTGAKVLDCQLSGSNYIRQSGGKAFIGYNKIGISTQGAKAGATAKIQRVGFERFLNSNIFVSSNSDDVLIEDCYTVGQQVGAYVDVDEDGLVVNWNATADSARLNAGRQVYCLTNFYNNAAGAKNVVIRRNNALNVNDSFVGHNSGAQRHVVYGNTSIKNIEGYYGGFGLDCAGGTDLEASSNTFEGYSYGAYVHDGAKRCSGTDNVFKAASGIVFEGIDTRENSFSGNRCILVPYGSTGVGAGIAFFNAGSSKAENNQINGGNSASRTVKILSAANNGAGLIRLSSEPHSIKRREIVEVSSVNGTIEANGLWEVIPVDATHLDLLRSKYSHRYIDGGTIITGSRGIIGGISKNIQSNEIHNVASEYLPSEAAK